ncbi:MAG: MmgE/PrpD family protein [Chloroflexi bacterium]|nr:MmgE/PrpD family protein [Chloroflexota bacterium]
MSRQAAEFIVNTTLETIPPEVVHRAKLHILDTIADSLVGLRAETSQRAARFAHIFGRSTESTVLADSGKASSVAATFANCMAADALDFEDGHMGCGAHCSAVSIPPALAIGERENSSGVELLEAVVVSYEVGLRVGLMIARQRGSAPIPTGPMGSCTAAAAAAKLLHLDTGHALNALGVAACTFPITIGGSAPMMGTNIKAAIGWSGLTGVASALQARLGFTGGSTPLNIRWDGTEPHPYYPFDGVNWEIMKTYFKPYPSCRFTHAPLDCFFRLVREHKLAADDVAQVVVETALRPSVLNCQQPINLEQAQFSIPFTIGSALAYGKVTVEEMIDHRVRDPKVLAQASKVHVQPNPEMEALFGRRYPAIVRITTTDGNEYVTRKETASGDFDDPLTEEQLRAKYTEASASVIGQERAQKVVQMVEDLEQVRSVRELVRLMTPEA